VRHRDYFMAAADDSDAANEAFDPPTNRQALVSQQLATKLGLCVQFPASSTDDPATIDDIRAALGKQ
jgi:hypothetical protein